MTWRYWSKRFVLALVIAAEVLFVVQWVKGHPASDAAAFAALWSVVFAALFTGIGYVRYRRNPCLQGAARPA